MFFLSAELLLIFGVFPAYVAFARPLGLPRAPWPLLLFLAAVCTVISLVRRSDMSRRQFWSINDSAAERRQLHVLLIRFVFCAVFLSAGPAGYQSAWQTRSGTRDGMADAGWQTRDGARGLPVGVAGAFDLGGALF